MIIHNHYPHSSATLDTPVVWSAVCGHHANIPWKGGTCVTVTIAAAVHTPENTQSCSVFYWIQRFYDICKHRKHKTCSAMITWHGGAGHIHGTHGTNTDYSTCKLCHHSSQRLVGITILWDGICWRDEICYDVR